MHSQSCIDDILSIRVGCCARAAAMAGCTGGVSACLLTALMSGAMNAHIIVISIEFVPVHGR